MDMLKATHSAAVELRVISVCILLCQSTGQPKSVNTKPVQDLTDEGSWSSLSDYKSRLVMVE